MAYDEKTIIRLLAESGSQRKAFEEIVRHYSQPLYWKIRNIVLSHDDADDVLQNTFVKAWMNLSEFKNLSKLSTWLYRIAINESLDFLRRKKHSQDLSVDEVASVANTLMADEFFDGDQAKALLYEAIDTLPDVQRMVFNLRYFDNMKYNEISQVLGTSEGALKASYHIAQQKVTEYLKKRQ